MLPLEALPCIFPNICNEFATSHRTVTHGKSAETNFRYNFGPRLGRGSFGEAGEVTRASSGWSFSDGVQLVHEFDGLNSVGIATNKKKLAT